MTSDSETEIDFADALHKLSQPRKPLGGLKAVRGLQKQVVPVSDSRTASMSGVRVTKRVALALAAAGHRDFADKIANCHRKRGICGSTYCLKCRGALSANLLKRTQNSLLREFRGNEDMLFGQVRHVTGLVDITSLQSNDIRHAINQARQWFQEAARRRPWFKTEGAFELELIDFKHMDQMSSLYSPEKKASLEALLAGTLTRPMHGDDEMVVLVHWHALVVGLDDTTGFTKKGIRQTTRESALSILRKRYHRHRQLYVQPLRRPKAASSIAKDIGRICSYPFKNLYRLKYSFEGSNLSNGEYVDLRALGELIHVYREVGKHGNKGLQISYGS